MPADAGIKFGHYVLLRRLARGGMAEVFLAQQRGLEGFDRRVAIKRILPHLADSTDFVKMFLAEAKLAAQLSHPNIVHIYEFGKVDHDYFIAMEYVDGVHVGQLLTPDGAKVEKLSPTLVARIGADAAAALHHAHELRSSSGKPLGLVHRDVSPANIMLSYDGVVKLCDFGIAKAAAVSDQLTNPGQVKGKYAYMSPEQTVAQQLDGRSDVFSLAIVLWELLAGRHAVPRGDAVVAMRMIRDGKLERLDAVAPQTPRALADAIAWALENRRDQRATAAELAQALEAFIKSSPELATPMQVATWVRGRFPREATGQVPALETPPGTAAVPKTAAGLPTPPSSLPNIVTPSNLIGASRVAGGDEASGPGNETGTSIFVATKDLIDVDTLKRKPFAPLSNETIVDRRGPDAPTVMATATSTLVDSDTRIDAAETEEELNFDETIERRASELVPARPSPTVIVSPSTGPRVPPPLASTPRVAPSAGHAQLAAHAQQHARRAPRVGPIDPARMRIIIAASGLVGLALISFLIALAAKGSHASTVAADARVVAAVVPDAATPTTPTPTRTDAAPIATLADAAVATEAFLEISTFPPGGTVRVGDQSRVAPAQLVVQAGAIGVDAELDGYAPVHRDETVEPGEHRTVEIAFTKKLAAPHAPASGKLTVRTSPYADVYENGKRLGETPFADFELPAGTHTLTFKNPLHPTVTKRVTIPSGKTVKLSFDLP